MHSRKKNYKKIIKKNNIKTTTTPTFMFYNVKNQNKIKYKYKKISI